MPSYKEAAFPLSYRPAEVKKIMDALYRLRSITVIGLAAMGKSNIVRFVVSHPEAKRHYLADKAGSFIFVHIDCNRTNCGSTAAILQEISYQLAESGVSPATEARADEADAPIRQLQSVLESQIQNMERGQNVALIFDIFDQAYEQLGPQFFRYLRYLRDMRGNVCFVFGSRRPPDSLPEIEELLVDPCWVGPLTHDDALGSIARDEQRLGVTFPKVEKKQLINVTGGHPGLLKNATELLCDQFIDPTQGLDRLAARLLEAKTIQDVCQDLWNDLTSQEQEALTLRVGNVSSHALDPEVVMFLRQTGLLVDDVNGEAVVFSRVFEKFIQTQELKRVIYVEVGSINNVRIHSWQGAQTIKLSPRQSRLLRFLAPNPEKVHGKPQLAAAVWPEDEYPWPSNKDALEQHISRLRDRLNPVLRELTGDHKYRFIVAVRSRGYKLDAEPHGGWRVEFRLKR